MWAGAQVLLTDVLPGSVVVLLEVHPALDATVLPSMQAARMIDDLLAQKVRVLRTLGGRHAHQPRARRRGRVASVRCPPLPLCPPQGSSTTVSRSDIRLIQHF
jgi:hypothetical protein